MKQVLTLPGIISEEISWWGVQLTQAHLNQALEEHPHRSVHTISWTNFKYYICKRMYISCFAIHITKKNKKIAAKGTQQILWTLSRNIVKMKQSHVHNFSNPKAIIKVIDLIHKTNMKALIFAC